MIYTWSLGLVVVGFILLALCLMLVCWRSGVVEGYGYSREPWNPDYREAGEFLRRTEDHRWTELRDRKGGPSD